MSQTIRSAKQKLANGAYSNPIPFGASGVNIDLKNGYNLEATLGEVDVANKGTIQSQLNKHTQDMADKVTKAEAASFIEGIDYNGSTYTFTFTKYDGSTQIVDLPLENLIDRGYFDNTTKEIVLILSTGEEVKIPAASLVDEYTGKNNTQIKTTVANNIIEAVLQTGSIDETYLTTVLQTRLTNMEDKYTKAEVDTLLSARSEFEEIDTW